MNGVWQKLRSVVPFWGKATSLGMPVGHSWFLWFSHSIFFFFCALMLCLLVCLCEGVGSLRAATWVLEIKHKPWKNSQ